MSEFLQSILKAGWDESKHPRGKSTPKSTPGSFAPATAMMQEWWDQTKEHPFDPSIRLSDWVGLEARRTPEGGVHLSSIISFEAKGKGQASAALDKFLALADKHGVTVDLLAKPIANAGAKGKSLTKRQLITWYKRHGFLQQGYTMEPDKMSDYMVRLPRPVKKSWLEVVKYSPDQPRNDHGRWVVWHLTDNPNFKLDSTRVPEKNTTIGIQSAAGLYVARNLEPWVNGYGYVRPFAVELKVPEDLSTPDPGMYSGERFIPASRFNDVEVSRVIPLDAYVHEAYKDYGWLESWRDGSSKPAKLPDSEHHYTGPDVRAMPREQQRAYIKLARDYVKANRTVQKYSPDQPRGKTTPESNSGSFAPIYSAAARESDTGTLVTSNIEDAIKALHAGRKVELNQPREVATLLDHMAAMAKYAKAHGQHAPVFNLCKVSVKGTNLFCADALDTARDHMPQFIGYAKPGTPADALPKRESGKVDITSAFQTYLATHGYTLTDEQEGAAYLRGSQMQLNGVKVAQMMHRLKDGRASIEGAAPLLVSADNYIIDGHHRWAAMVGLDSENNVFGDLKIPIQRVNIKILALLLTANQFADYMGMDRQGHHETKLRKCTDDTCGVDWLEGVLKWDESLHPRGKTTPESRGGSFAPSGVYYGMRNPPKHMVPIRSTVPRGVHTMAMGSYEVHANFNPTRDELFDWGKHAKGQIHFLCWGPFGRYVVFWDESEASLPQIESALLASGRAHKEDFGGFFVETGSDTITKLTRDINYDRLFHPVRKSWLQVIKDAVWNEAEHPRQPAGSTAGGEFARKDEIVHLTVRRSEYKTGRALLNKVDVLYNPTYSGLMRYLPHTSKEVRFVRVPSTGRYYVWDAYDEMHEKIVDALERDKRITAADSTMIRAGGFGFSSLEDFVRERGLKKSWFDIVKEAVWREEEHPRGKTSPDSTPGSFAPKGVEEGPGAEVKPGQDLIVYRAQARGSGLVGNAGNVGGVAGHLVSMDDNEGPAPYTFTWNGLRIYAYRVKAPEKFGRYYGRIGGASRDKQDWIGRADMSSKQDRSVVWYAFPEGTQAEPLGSVSIEEVRATLKEQIDDNNFDWAGGAATEAAIREAFRRHVRKGDWDETEHPRGKSTPESTPGSFRQMAQALSDAVAHTLSERLKEVGGFTYQPYTLDSPTEGYALSIVRDKERVFKGGVTEADVAKYEEENAALFAANPHAHFGGWLDVETGNVYLDISIIEPILDKAISLAQQHGQEGIYDLGKGQTIIVKRPEERRKAEAGEGGLSAGRDPGADRGAPEQVARAGWLQEVLKDWNEADHPRGKTTADSTPGSFAPSRWSAHQETIRDLVAASPKLTVEEVKAGKYPLLKYTPQLYGSDNVVAQYTPNNSGEGLPGSVTLTDSYFKRHPDKKLDAIGRQTLLLHEFGHAIPTSLGQVPDANKVWEPVFAPFRKGTASYEWPGSLSNRPEEIMADVYSELMYSKNQPWEDDAGKYAPVYKYILGQAERIGLPLPSWYVKKSWLETVHATAADRSHG